MAQWFGSLRSSRLFGVLAIVVLAIAIPITVFIAQTRQEVRQRASETCATSTHTGVAGQTGVLQYDFTAQDIIHYVKFLSVDNLDVMDPNGQTIDTSHNYDTPTLPRTLSLRIHPHDMSRGGTARLGFVINGYSDESPCITPSTDIGGSYALFNSAPTAVPPSTTPTPTPIPAVACSPRPAVSISTTPVGQELRTTVSVQGDNNTLRQIRFGDMTGGTVFINGLTRTSGSNIELSFGQKSVTFNILQTTACTTVNIPFTVFDGCGEWPTFAGGGAAAFNTCPTATPIPPTNTPQGHKIEGTVFIDTNGNGTQDTGEEGLSGVTVTLNTTQIRPPVAAAGDEVARTTTASTGYYKFLNLTRPDYWVTVFILPSGYTAPDSRYVQLANTDKIANFGVAQVPFNYHPADVNHDRHIDTTDAGLIVRVLTGAIPRQSDGRYLDGQTQIFPDVDGNGRITINDLNRWYRARWTLRTCPASTDGTSGAYTWSGSGDPACFHY